MHECPTCELLAQDANRLRQNTRPKHPVDLDFSLEENHIPDGFFQADVTVNSRRPRRHRKTTSVPQQSQDLI